MQSSLYLIRSRSLAKSDVSGNETAAESSTTDQNTSESAAVGEVEEEQETETVEESEIVQDAQEKNENDQESGAVPDSVISDQRPQSDSLSENIVQDAQNQNTDVTEESGEYDAERSENVKEVIKEIVMMDQQETDVQVIQTVPEPEYIISTDDYRIISILLLSAVLGAIIATAFLNVINRGL